MATESLALGVLLGAAVTALAAYALHLRGPPWRRRSLLTAAMAASLASVGVRLLPRFPTTVPSFALVSVALYFLFRAWSGDESSSVGTESDAPARNPQYSSVDPPGRSSPALGGVHVPDSVESKRVSGAVVALATLAAVAVAFALADSLAARAAITVVTAVPLGRLFGYLANRIVGEENGPANGSG